MIHVHAVSPRFGYVYKYTGAAHSAIPQPEPQRLDYFKDWSRWELGAEDGDPRIIRDDQIFKSSFAQAGMEVVASKNTTYVFTDTMHHSKRRFLEGLKSLQQKRKDNKGERIKLAEQIFTEAQLNYNAGSHITEAKPAFELRHHPACRTSVEYNTVLPAGHPKKYIWATHEEYASTPQHGYQDHPVESPTSGQ